MWSTVLGVVAIAALGARLVQNFQKTRARKKTNIEALFSDVLNVIEEPVFEQQDYQGYPRLSGRYGGYPVQIKPVVDTLAIRRLPALWLLVTVQDRLPVKARFDMMMRPAGPTTFSNFDLLPRTLEHLDGFPEHAVIRTDDPEEVLPAHLIKPHLSLFFGSRAKELLITENGLRMVWLLAEGDRARYGIFRQAEFGTIAIDAKVLRDILDCLLAIRHGILDWDKNKK